MKGRVMRQSGIGIRWAKVAASAWLCALALGLSGRVPEPGSKPISGVILHVDDDAPSGGDGLSWESPLRYLQDALTIANTPGNGVSEIRLGQGVYKPDQGVNQLPGNIHAVFNVGAIGLRGGYAGFGADDPDARDFKLYETILSGDLLGNDGPPGSFQNYGDNSYRLILITNETETTTVEGITLTSVNPFSIEAGGAIRALSAKPVVMNCTFQHNQARLGGGIRLSQCDATVMNCKFFLNRATAVGGGGLSAFLSSVQIVDCTFESNAALQAACGGAILLDSSNATTEGCTFLSNYSNTDGGAAELDFGSDALWLDCVFIDNSALCAGGAVASGEGFQGPGTAGTFINCEFRDNLASLNHGGAVRGKGEFINCRFIENYAGDGGGATMPRGTSAFINCEFRGNQASGLGNGGGGVWVPGFTGTSAGFVNCIFNANQSWNASGGGVHVSLGGSASFANCTFINNVAVDDQGGALFGEATITNSILWNNSPAQLDGTFDVSYSCIEGGWAGIGNIDLDPQFVDALGMDRLAGTEDDDLRLSPGSPCIDAGDNTALPADDHDLDGDSNIVELLPFDFAGNLRRINDPKTPDTGNPGIYHLLVDMGAMEFADFKAVFADITGDGVVGVEDLLAVISFWGPCPDDPQVCPADLDRSGATDLQDLLLVLTNWM